MKPGTYNDKTTYTGSFMSKASMSYFLFSRVVDLTESELDYVITFLKEKDNYILWERGQHDR